MGNEPCIPPIFKSPVAAIPNSEDRSPIFRAVPTTPDPYTSAKASRYKWEPYRDTNWCRLYYFLQEEGPIFAKVSR